MLLTEMCLRNNWVPKSLNFWLDYLHIYSKVPPPPPDSLLEKRELFYSTPFKALQRIVWTREKSEALSVNTSKWLSCRDYESTSTAHICRMKKTAWIIENEQLLYRLKTGFRSSVTQTTFINKRNVTMLWKNG